MSALKFLRSAMCFHNLRLLRMTLFEACSIYQNRLCRESSVEMGRFYSPLTREDCMMVNNNSLPFCFK